jgi:2-dehydro-3-deoxygalactonokinase
MLEHEDNLSAIYIDAGTTNTRVWLMRGKAVLSRTQAQVGVRDSARDGSTKRLTATLRDLIEKARATVRVARKPPACVVASGMITSSLGLAEVPHIPTPAGIDDLGLATEVHRFPDVTDLPVLLVPGVRSGPMPCDLATAGKADLMRGEETLCAGLLMLGITPPPVTVLSLGSHWKAIQLDNAGRIVSSSTSLSGEMIHFTQTQTILASAVPQGRPAFIDARWLEAGMSQQRQSGLARALFGVRLLEQSKQGSPEERLSFLVGVFIASDVDAWQRAGMLSSSVAIVGSGGLVEAWRRSLNSLGDALQIQSQVITDIQREQAILAGLRSVASSVMSREAAPR